MRKLIQSRLPRGSQGTLALLTSMAPSRIAKEIEGVEPHILSANTLIHGIRELSTDERIAAAQYILDRWGIRAIGLAPSVPTLPELS